jgi:hypothetical protein
MAVQCKITSNAQVIYPELPIDHVSILIEDSRRQLNGTLRTAFRAEKARLRYGLRGATEAELTTWVAAHPRNASFSVTDERPITATYKVVAFAFPLSRTEPAVQGGTNTTGPGYYDISVELEEV